MITRTKTRDRTKHEQNQCTDNNERTGNASDKNGGHKEAKRHIPQTHKSTGKLEQIVEKLHTKRRKTDNNSEHDDSFSNEMKVTPKERNRIVDESYEANLTDFSSLKGNAKGEMKHRQQAHSGEGTHIWIEPILDTAHGLIPGNVKREHDESTIDIPMNDQKESETVSIKEISKPTQTGDELKSTHQLRRANTENSESSNTIPNEGFEEFSVGNRKRKNHHRDLDQHVDTFHQGTGNNSSEEILSDGQSFKFQLTKKPWNEIQPVDITYSNGRVMRRMGATWMDISCG